MYNLMYRGKRKNDGKWVFGFYSDFYNSKIGSFIITPKDAFEVDKKTVGLCLDVKDKNGKVVFEGDIVKISNLILTYESGEKILFDPFNLEVIYRWGCFLFSTKQDISNYFGLYIADFWLSCGDEAKASFEVIGNIYDSKNLIESGSPLMDRIHRNIS